MLGQMFTDAEAFFDFGRATYSTPSFNAAAYRFAERDPGTAAHSASSSDTAADAYRFAASHSEATPVSRIVNEKSWCALPMLPLAKRLVIFLTFLLAKLRSNH